jgi:uncharacterized protein YeaO (DUF488 family)
VNELRVRRIYDPPSAKDGTRVLVDRLWPRGLKKEKAKIDLWLKDAAPSAELRQWFDHDPQRWSEFQTRYRKELADNAQALVPLHDLVDQGKPLTLLFAAKDEEHNNAVALKEILTARRTSKASGCTPSDNKRSVTSYQTNARHRRASIRHRSAGRDCIGLSPAFSPSRAAAHSFLRR